MKQQTKFDLNQELEIWRATLLDSNRMEEENILELENHLLDQMEDLTGNGLSDDEAYWVAQKRLGQPTVLVTEYQKVEQMPLGNWLRTVIGGTALVLIFISTVYSLSSILSGLGHSYITSCSGAIFLGMLGIFAVLIPVFSKLISLERMKSFLELQVIKHTLVLVGLAFAMQILQRLTFDLLLNRMVFSLEMFSHVMISSMLMTFVVILTTLIGFMVNIKSRRHKIESEYV